MTLSITFTHVLIHANHLESPALTSVRTSSKNSDDNANYALLFYNYISKEYIKKMGEINTYYNFILNFKNKI